MNVAVAVLNERMPEVLEALDKKEEVVVSHEGKQFRLQPAWDIEAEIERLKKHPAVGMWDDREDMKDPGEWVRNLRKPRYTNIFGTTDGDGEDAE